jgi:RNA polymerase sigma factor for flagellar operon FliA
MATLRNHVIDDRATLICDHLPLVGHLVREVLVRLPPHVLRDELVSAGGLALVQAAQSFDSALGVPFGRFAARRIRGALLDELRGMDWASRSVRRRARSLEALKSQLTAALGRQPTTVEVAATSGLTVQELASHERDVAVAVVSSWHVIEEKDDEYLVSRTSVEPVDVLLDRERMAYVADGVAALPPRLRFVIDGYFLRQLPMADLAAVLGVTESRISQMRAEALDLMRHALTTLLDDNVVVDGRGAVARRRRAEYVRQVAGVRRPRARLAYVPDAALSPTA